MARPAMPPTTPPAITPPDTESDSSGSSLGEGVGVVAGSVVDEAGSEEVDDEDSVVEDPEVVEDDVASALRDREAKSNGRAVAEGSAEDSEEKVSFRRLSGTPPIGLSLVAWQTLTWPAEVDQLRMLRPRGLNNCTYLILQCISRSCRIGNTKKQTPIHRIAANLKRRRRLLRTGLVKSGTRCSSIPSSSSACRSHYRRRRWTAVESSRSRYRRRCHLKRIRTAYTLRSREWPGRPVLMLCTASTRVMRW